MNGKSNKYLSKYRNWNEYLKLKDVFGEMMFLILMIKLNIAVGVNKTLLPFCQQIERVHIFLSSAKLSTDTAFLHLENLLSYVTFYINKLPKWCIY